MLTLGIKGLSTHVCTRSLLYKAVPDRAWFLRKCGISDFLKKTDQNPYPETKTWVKSGLSLGDLFPFKYIMEACIKLNICCGSSLSWFENFQTV